MSALSDLRRLIGRQTQDAATVVAVTTTGIQVSTRHGVKTLKRSMGDATDYRAGDRVRVVGDTVSGRLDQNRQRYVL